MTNTIVCAAAFVALVAVAFYGGQEYLRMTQERDIKASITNSVPVCGSNDPRGTFICRTK